MAVDTPAQIAILGGGPIGLEAALYARFLGYQVDLYERGGIGEYLQTWGHAPLYTPFAENASPLGVASILTQDPLWRPPADDALLTGREYLERYLLPLSRCDLIGDSIHEHTEVLAVGRAGITKGRLIDDDRRVDSDFRILLRTGTAPEVHFESSAFPHERIATADVVLDCTGVGQRHGYLGDGGLPAIGELAAQSHIAYRVPDILGADRECFAGCHTLVVGTDYAAAMAVVALAELAREVPYTQITWLTGSHDESHRAGPIRDDNAAVHHAAHNIINLANALVQSNEGHLTFCPQTGVQGIVWHAGGPNFRIRLSGQQESELEVDRVIACVGERPDHSLSAELHLAVSAYDEAALMDTHGATDPRRLLTAEPDFYVLGRKSFGRRGDFVIRDGLNQIRDLFTIVGDRHDLDLYATARKQLA